VATGHEGIVGEDDVTRFTTDDRFIPVQVEHVLVTPSTVRSQSRPYRGSMGEPKSSVPCCVAGPNPCSASFTASNLSTCRPIRSKSPSVRACGLRSLRKMPLIEPRSFAYQPVFARTKRRCRGET